MVAIIYMVGGISSRFGSIKQFVKVGPNNESLIEYSLLQALSAGFDKIIFVVGEKTEKEFKEKFGDNYNNVPVYYALQEYGEDRDKPWGTADALVTAKPFVKESFVVCNGDDIYGENSFKILVEHLKNQDKDNEATLGYKLNEVLPDVGKAHRGIYKIENNYVQDIRETFDLEKNNLGENKDKLCSMNIFAFREEVLSLLEEKLILFKKENKEDRSVECLLPEEISNLIKEGRIKMRIYKSNDKWLGITNPGDEEIVREELRNS